MIPSPTTEYNPELVLTTIGNNLSALRKSKGLTRATVAYNAHISLSTLYRLETGKCGKVRVWALFDLSEYYKIEPHTLLIQEKYYKSAT